MEWEIELYEDESGYCPVEEFVEVLQPKEKAKVIWMIDLLERTGINLTEPYAKHIEGSLWELRPKSIRILYFLYEGIFVLFHIFRKKTRKTPKGEISTAIERMEDYRRRKEE